MAVSRIEHFKQRWKVYVFVVLPLAAFVLLAFTGFLSDMFTGLMARVEIPFGAYGSSDYYGEESLEERIAGSDVIAMVKLRSVSQVVEHHGYLEEAKAYGVALEFTFDVLEYLKGSGGNTLVGVVYDTDAPFNTKLGASMFGENLLAERDTRWDGREAIVFLSDNHPSLPSSKKADRYWFGILRFMGEDHYTIASPHAKNWLPSASPPSGSAGSASTDPSFLLDVPSQGSSQATTWSSAIATSTDPVIKLSQLKARIGLITSEVNAGDGSTAYEQCVQLKYETQRRLQHKVDFFASLGDTFKVQERHDFDSGRPAGNDVYTDSVAPFLMQYTAEPPNRGADTFKLFGEDGKLFTVRWAWYCIVCEAAACGPVQLLLRHPAHRDGDMRRMGRYREK